VKARLIVLLAALALLAAVSPVAVGVAPAQAAAGSTSLVPTFSSVGVYWSPAGGGSKVTGKVSYRELGSSSWMQGSDLWFDGRAVADRPAEYRGSLVDLEADTTYEVRLELAGTSTSVIERVQTWSEDHPIGSVVELPATSTKPVDLQRIGSPTGYVLLTGPNGGPATIDLQGKYDYGVRLTNSAYVVIRGVTITGARHHGIQLGTSTSDDVHDIVIEGNDINHWGVKDSSGFGTPMDSAVYSNTSKLTRVVIQGNRMTSPNTTANSWSQSHNGSKHPAGPQGITLLRGAGNNVIRHNDIVGDATHHLNDGMGATANFGTSGFPGRDSDVYGNYIAYTWDDGIEAEGGGMNVRLYDNYVTEVYHAFGLAAVSQGPLYAYRNVQDVARSDATATYGQAMFKMGGNTYKEDFYGDGRTYLFHNTALKPLEGPRNRKAIEAGDGRVLRNTISRNNILGTGAPSGSYSISDDSRSTTNSFDYDLYNGLIRAAAGAESHGVKAEAVHAAGWGMDEKARTGSFALAAGSNGVDDGVPLPGFNDGWRGDAPDMGAQEAGSAPQVYGAAAFRAAPSTPSAAAESPAVPTPGAPTPAPPVEAPPTDSGPTAGVRTITVTAVADGMIKQASPTEAFGAASPLLSDGRDLESGRSAVNSFLRFDVAGLEPGERVVTAALSVHTVPRFGGTNNGPAIWRTADASSVSAAESMTWRENRPARGAAPVGNFGAAGHDARVGTVVTGISGNGVVSFELAPEVTNGMIFSSSEDADVAARPQLILVVSSR